MTTGGKIDAAIAAAEKEGLIAWRLASKRAASGVARRVTFSFDDATAQPAHRHIMNQRFPDEIPRKLKGVQGQVSSAESLDAALMKFHWFTTGFGWQGSDASTASPPYSSNLDAAYRDRSTLSMISDWIRWHPNGSRPNVRCGSKAASSPPSSSA